MMIIHADCKTCGVHFHYERHSGGGALRKYCDQHSYAASAVAARNEGRCCAACGTDISGRHGAAIVCSRECALTIKRVGRKPQGNGVNARRQSAATKRAVRAEVLALRRIARRQGQLLHGWGKCPGCRGIFRKSKDNTICCSRECSGSVNAIPVQTCAACKQQFKPRSRDRMTCCSRECGFEYLKILGAVTREITAIRRIASRKGVNRPPIRCDSCGTPFRPIYTWHRYCGPSCRDEDARNKDWESRRGAVKACTWCGVEWCATKEATASHGFCSDECRDKRARQHKRDSKRRRSARIKEGFSEFVDRLKVFDRDGWQCNACGCDTPRDMLGLMEDDAPELDHIVPLAAGGDHSYENTQLLCRMCNGLKGTMMMPDFIKEHGLERVSKTMA